MTNHKDNDKWVDIVRHKVDDYEVSPPEGLFENIRDDLHPHITKYHQLRRIIAYAAAILLLAGIPLSIYLNRDNDNTAVNNRISTNGNRPNITADRTEGNGDNNHNVDNSSVADNRINSTGSSTNRSYLCMNNMSAQSAAHPVQRVASAEQTLATTQDTPENSSADNSRQDMEKATTASQQTSSKDKTDKQTVQSVKKHSYLPPTNEGEQLLASNATAGKDNRGWTFAVSMGSSTDKSSNNDNEYTAIDVTNMSNCLFATSFYQEATNNAQNGSNSFSSLGQTEVKLKHHLPIRIGITVSKEISKHISLSTGLTGTYLSSSPNDSRLNNSYRQRIYYVGIPIRVNYKFLNIKRFSLYWSNGGEAEKCIYAKRGDQHLHIPDIQFSAGTSLGAQYMLTRKLGIYAEPGLTYYWGNGTDIETYRTENPLGVDIHVGLKLNY